MDAKLQSVHNTSTKLRSVFQLHMSCGLSDVSAETFLYLLQIMNEQMTYWSSGSSALSYTLSSASHVVNKNLQKIENKLYALLQRDEGFDSEMLELC